MHKINRYMTAALVVTIMICDSGLAAPKKQAEPLNAEGTKALAEYTAMLDALRSELQPQIPAIDAAQKATFLSAYAGEKGKEHGSGKKKKIKGNDYSNGKAALASMKAAKPILADVDGFLSSGALDAKLVKCTVLAQATPRGLAEFVQQGVTERKLISYLLGNPKLMRRMLYAGGAKGGRYGKAMQIYRSILATRKDAREDGVLNRLAIATSLELAAPDLTNHWMVDPVKRFNFFADSYLNKELDPHFAKHSIWLLRQVIKDPSTEADMAWMRDMLWNYRPDFIRAPDGFRARYVGLMYSEFGHKAPEWDADAPTTKHQQALDRGGQCGPKASFGRCLGRSFGIPVWGARLWSHTAMTYWTPNGWTEILGSGFHNAFWNADRAEPMRARLFKLMAMSREHPDAFIKVCRAQWAGEVLGEKRVDGMRSGTGGLWPALALNKMRAIVIERHPPMQGRHQVPWAEDAYKKEAPWNPEEIMTPTITAADRKITTDAAGNMEIPAVACVSPTTNTSKIVFMDGRDGRKLLHYKRWKQPEPFRYEITVERAGTYLLSVDLVTVNREQFLLLTVNGAAKPLRIELPYTVGKWGRTEPIAIALKAGQNVLEFTRTVPPDFDKKGFMHAGPEFGGITMRTFRVTRQDEKTL